MRCKACDCILKDHETTRRSDITGDYFDLCDDCLSTIFDNVPDFDYAEDED